MEIKLEIEDRVANALQKQARHQDEPLSDIASRMLKNSLNRQDQRKSLRSRNRRNKTITGDEYELYATLCKRIYTRAFSHRKFGFDSHKMFSNYLRQQRAALVTNDQEIVLVFRGTSHRGDWSTNLNCFPSEFKIDDCNVYGHRGFLEQLDRIDMTSTDRLKKEKRITDDISLLGAMEYYLCEELEKKVRPIIIAGHSLGGALAVLAASRFSEKIRNNISTVYTFGQPAAGLDSFANNYPLDEKTFRITAGVDIVTFMPPGFYRHVGQHFWIHAGKVWQDVPWYRIMWKSLSFAVSSMILDHLMDGYIKNREYFVPFKKS
jgi:predicted lipase